MAIKPEDSYINAKRDVKQTADAKPPVPSRPAALQSLGAMPPLSAVAIQIQRLTQADVDMRTVANAISVDPGLSADVLRLANSALFGARHTVPGVLHAIVMLGLDRVKTLVFTAAFMRYANPSRSEGATKRSWRHSVACALIADELSSRTHLDRDAAYTAGILHDIGRMAMLRLWLAPYSALLDSAVPGSAEILDEERGAFGLDHTEAGDYLLRRWQLPSSLTAAAKHHHDTPPQASRRPLALSTAPAPWRTPWASRPPVDPWKGLRRSPGNSSVCSMAAWKTCNSASPRA